MAQPKYGSREGLSSRLNDWITRLATDKTLPWPGLGLLADLKAARDALDGVPVPVADEPEEWEIAATKKLEFDL